MADRGFLSMVEIGFDHLRMLRMSTSSPVDAALRSGRVGPGLDARVSPAARVTVDRGVRIARRLTLRVDGLLTIGEGTFINSDAHIVARERVSIGKRVRFGERVSVHDENHLFEPISARGASWDEYSTSPIRIGDYAWIGCGVIILSGSTVGDYAVVAAGSVVKGDVPPRTLVAGSPARVIRSLGI